MKIEVEAVTGKRFKLKVSSVDTIKNVKTKLQLQEGILMDDQQLLFYQGKRLKDARRLKKYEIQNGSTVFLVDLNIFHKKEIFVKTTTGKIIPIEIEDIEYLREFKIKIEAKEGIPADQQRLISNGKKLENVRTLKYYKIERGATIQLFVDSPPSYEEMEINVKRFSSNSVPLKVRSSDRIIDVKKQLQKKIISPAHMHRFIINSMVMQDDCTLRDYNIQPKSTIIMLLIHFFYVQIPLKVKMLSGKVITLKLDKHELVQNVKKMIEEKENIPKRNQWLTYNGLRLEDRRCISEYFIDEKSTIYLVSRVF